jgi:DNA gyrase subunit A
MSVYKQNVKTVMEDSFLTYAGYVILNRSVPDARDGLKYSARQLIYAQYKDKIISGHPMKKAQRSVAAATSRYYVHGDSSAYGTYVRMAKPFAFRYPLQDAQGNYGTPIDPKDHSAARYLEIRASAIATHLFEGINKNTISQWKENYDQTDEFPSVLPSKGFYNIVNGASGIAVGMSTSIPQFNLKEVNTALIKLLKNPNANFDDLYCPIDFATGGTIINEDEVKLSLESGRGKSAKIRATIDYNITKHQLIVSEMPYSVYTNTVCGQLQKLFDEIPTVGIKNFIDATGERPCIKINLTPKANPERVKSWLYKNTSLGSFYSINMTMLDKGTTPKQFGWVEALNAYVDHFKIVSRNELVFDRDKAEQQLHIKKGYIVAIDNIDEIVKIIKGSDNQRQAKDKLITRFNFTEDQVEAILNLKLQRLVSLEKLKIVKEIEKLKELIKKINNILDDEKLFTNELIKELEFISKKYGDNRRTKNMTLEIILDDEEPKPIELKKIVVVVSNNGAIKAIESDKIATQHKGGLGKSLQLENNDYIVDTIYGSNDDSVMLISNKGVAHTLTLGKIPLNEQIYLHSFINIDIEENIKCVIPYNKLNEYKYVIIATRKGMIKKSLLTDYKSTRTKGLIGIKLKEGDSVASVQLIKNEDDSVFIASSKGFGVHLKSSDIRSTGRSTMGVIGIKLVNDYVVDLDVLDYNIDYHSLASITENGLAKGTVIGELSYNTRATKGNIIHKIKDGDKLSSIKLLQNKKDILIISNSSVIKIKHEDIRISGKNTIGTKLMKIKNNDKVIKLTQTY